MIKARDLKKRIYEENLVKELLEKIGMHHIQVHNEEDYYTCGMPDGDNTSSTTVYNDENLVVKAYTRIDKITDIISLVQYTQSLTFTEALRWICNELQLDNDTDLFSVEKLQQMPSDKYIQKLSNTPNVLKDENVQELKIYDSKCLNKYCESCYAEYSDIFEKDNISKETQKQFGVIPYLEFVDINWCTTYYNQYDIIPIYDEIGNLVGIKARRYGAGVDKFGKYYYPLPCEKSQILFGLFFTKNFIDEKKEVIICESEKGVMQLWELGVKNAIGIGGHNLSEKQIEKIVKLNVDKVVIAFDEDVNESTLYTEYEKLQNLVREVVCIIDKEHILNFKESPMDNPKKWEELYKKCQYVPDRWGI